MKPLALQKTDVEGGFEDWAATFGADRGDEVDYCSREGALELKRKIEAYWAERGQAVSIMLHNVGFHPAIRAARFDVRSDLINGMPRPKNPAAAAPQDVFIEDYDRDADDIDFE